MSNEGNNMSSPFNITIDRQVIKLLGAHLYGDTPSIINELVANAYDAGAKRVWISVKTSEPYQIQVQDDGIGMSLDDINNYYLNIGYNRRAQEQLQKELIESGRERPDMGQKGIGKLSVFALSKTVRLVSIKNGQSVGCFLDFDVICQKDGQPMPFDTDKYELRDEDLSEKKSGTLIILENVVKDLSKSFKYIASNLARSFILNNDDISIFIRKDEENFKEIKRSNLCYTEYIDVLATIGENFVDIIQQVQGNHIEEKYKRIFSYEEMVEETKDMSSSKKRFDQLPLAMSVFNKDKSSMVPFDFKFSGWIGTVKDENSFTALLEKDGYTREEISDKNIIVVDDNRISIYSRGKIGEYNILPKLKTKAANDAYIIGEIYVDDFEDDKLIDMATSNRRGYQEDDPRYEALCRNLKLLVSRVVNAKQTINKKRKDDEAAEEASQIKKEFAKGHIKSKKTFENMPEEDRRAIEEDHRQFARAVSLSNNGSASIKKLLISHRQDGLEEYGNFIIDILLSINPELKNRIVFTSNPSYGLPKGKDLFDSLKECFRPDFYVAFLFTKSFYDSNVCLAEAGAAWATNTDYINIIIDINFNEIDKPINNSIGGTKFCFNSESEKNDFSLVLQAILKNIDKEYDLTTIRNALENEIQNKESQLELPNYVPTRKFQIVPYCKKCKKTMPIAFIKGKAYYKCAHSMIPAEIK